MRNITAKIELNRIRINCVKQLNLDDNNWIAPFLLYFERGHLLKIIVCQTNVQISKQIRAYF